ncbi:MAG: hypothetical protein LBF04_03640 [Prevotellaceae bacterium]|jgi:hypothetical protein|nr:hypothetical protein [Prevotellaceae bacterium]
MDITEIKTLLQKFYEGETTLEEEKLLQKYFAESKDNIENFAAEKYLFANLKFAENIEIPSDLTEKISAKTDDEIKNIRTHKYLLSTKLRLMSAAACIVLLISVMATFITGHDEPKFIANVDTNEAEMLEILSRSFSSISNVVDDAVVLLDITDEQVCEINEVLNNL